MLEEMTLEELQAEHKRASQLASLCQNMGFPQAATVHRMTAEAILCEITGRG